MPITDKDQIQLETIGFLVDHDEPEALVGELMKLAARKGRERPGRVKERWQGLNVALGVVDAQAETKLAPGESDESETGREAHGHA